MITEKTINEIKEKLNYGEEVVVTCATITRAEEIRKQTFDFPGKLRIRLIG